MDYDKTEIATRYDKARALEPGTLRLWKNTLAAHVDQTLISLVIDLGSGTGRFSELLATYLRGEAESLPLQDGCADLAFMSMVYHHFADPVAVVQECHRVLRPGGYVCVRNSTRESEFPHRHFFPAMERLIDSDLPSRLEIETAFTANGFGLVVCEVAIQTTAPNWPSFIEKTALRADSFLARLSDEDFQQGMAAMRNQNHGIKEDEAVSEEIGWFVFTRNKSS
jgi:SAM-dependent methyltransferase